MQAVRELDLIWPGESQISACCKNHMTSRRPRQQYNLLRPLHSLHFLCANVLAVDFALYQLQQLLVPAASDQLERLTIGFSYYSVKSEQNQVPVNRLTTLFQPLERNFCK